MSASPQYTESPKEVVNDESNSLDVPTQQLANLGLNDFQQRELPPYLRPLPFRVLESGGALSETTRPTIAERRLGMDVAAHRELAEGVPAGAAAPSGPSMASHSTRMPDPAYLLRGSYAHVFVESDEEDKSGAAENTEYKPEEKSDVEMMEDSEAETELLFNDEPEGATPDQPEDNPEEAPDYMTQQYLRELADEYDFFYSDLPTDPGQVQTFDNVALDLVRFIATTNEQNPTIAAKLCRHANRCLRVERRLLEELKDIYQRKENNGH